MGIRYPFAISSFSSGVYELSSMNSILSLSGAGIVFKSFAVAMNIALLKIYIKIYVIVSIFSILFRV